MQLSRLSVWKRALPALLVAGAIAVAGCATRGDAQTQTAEPVVLPPATYGAGTVVCGLDVGGKTEDEAREMVRAFFATLPERTTTITYGRWSAPRSYGELGVSANVDAMLEEAWTAERVPLRLSYDLGKIKASLRRAARAIDRPSEGARFVGKPGHSAIKPGRDGRRLNVPASAERVRMSLEQDWRDRSIPLLIEDVPAPSTVESLSALTTLVTRFTTSYNPRERNRTHNLLMVAERLNGGYVDTGQTFSFNETVGERRASEGFLEAIVYRDGMQVRETAGGLCQVSSTLYNVALLAGLPIVQRSNHSLTVHYVPAGRDATVYWGSHDLQFRNDLDTPLYIRAFAGRGRLTVEAWGAQPLERKVTVWSTSARRGDHLFSNTYRRIVEAGVSRTERLSSDRYDTVHRTAPRRTASRRAVG